MRGRRAGGERESTAATTAPAAAASNGSHSVNDRIVIGINGSSGSGGGSTVSTTATAILSVTRNSEVAGSTSDEATGVLTWLLRTCPTAHSDCSKLGDEKYVTELAR